MTPPPPGMDRRAFLAALARAGLGSAALASLPPRKAAEMLISAARVRAKGRGDNVSVAIVKLVQT